MANLLEAIEVAYRQVFPKPTSDTPVTRDEFVVSGKLEYALQVWQMSKAEKREEGFYALPSHSIVEVVKEVKDNSIDISDLKPLRALSNDGWLVNVGGIGCDCRYVKSNVNRSILLADDDGLSDNDKLYLLIGKKIIFPRGTHKDKLPITYVDDGTSLDPSKIEVDDVLAGIVRDRLVEKYLGKSNKQDVTEDSNPNK